MRRKAGHCLATANQKIKIGLSHPSKKLSFLFVLCLTSLEVIDHHDLRLFEAGLIEDDGVSVAGG
jgi:hypothetical protein